MTNLWGADTQPDPERARSYDGALMKAGKKAEDIVIDWLTLQPWVIGVDDLRSLKVMREADVDCSVSLVDGRVTLAEIKSDRHIGRSGNFLFEVLRINHTCSADKVVTLGWSAKTPARYLLYYAPFNHTIHKIGMDEFRLACQAYTKSARRHTNLNYVETDAIKSTVNILIPEHYVTRFDSYKAFKLEEET